MLNHVHVSRVGRTVTAHTDNRVEVKGHDCGTGKWSVYWSSAKLSERDMAYLQGYVEQWIAMHPEPEPTTTTRRQRLLLALAEYVETWTMRSISTDPMDEVGDCLVELGMANFAMGFMKAILIDDSCVDNVAKVLCTLDLFGPQQLEEMGFNLE
jgi:hypothetical protein